MWPFHNVRGRQVTTESLHITWWWAGWDLLWYITLVVYNPKLELKLNDNSSNKVAYTLPLTIQLIHLVLKKSDYGTAKNTSFSSTCTKINKTTKCRHKWSWKCYSNVVLRAKVVNNTVHTRQLQIVNMHINNPTYFQTKIYKQSNSEYWWQIIHLKCVPNLPKKNQPRQ